MTQRRRKVLATMVILAMPVALWLTYMLCRPQLPSRIPDPYNWSGGLISEDNGIHASSAFFGNFLSFVLLGAILVLILRNGRHRGTAIAVSFAAGMGPALTIKSMLISYNAPTLSAVQPRFWQYLLTLLLLGAYVRLLAFVSPIPPQPDQIIPSPSSIILAPGRRVMWFGQATSRGRLCGGLTVLVASVPIAVASPSASIAMLLVAGWVLWGSMTKVRIDDNGVTVTHRPLGWPKIRVPLDEIAGASTETFGSLQYGDGKPQPDQMDPRSLIIRGGEAVVFHNRHHLPMYVSVDHAEEAANVANALVARAQIPS